jgi:hypothetical protein
MTTSRRQLLRRALIGSAALLAACRTPLPVETPPPPAPTEPPATPTALPATIAPSPTAAPPSPLPTASPTRAAVFLPGVESNQPPTPAPPTAVPTARPAPPTSTAGPPAPTAPPRPTDTPRPTPPPGPTPGQRVPISKITKWGLGVYREGNEIFDDLYAAKPTVILLMDPTPGWARRIREWFPKAFVVGRIFRNEVSQQLDNPGPRGGQFADTVAQSAVPLKGVVDAWISYNEVTARNGYEDYKRYNEFQVAFAKRLQDVHGIPAVAGNDGSGTVEPFDYPKYFADAIKASKFFGVHAYSPLGSHQMRQESEWHALRYRKIHAELEQAGIKDIKMVMTESGLGDGWHGRVDDVLMTEDFFWFTDELEKDPYVIGHAAYGLFGGLDGMWKTFEMKGTDILTRMGHYEPPSRRPPPKP